MLFELQRMGGIEFAIDRAMKHQLPFGTLSW
jgi:hypothetical protein